MVSQWRSGDKVVQLHGGIAEREREINLLYIYKIEILLKPN